MYSGFQKFDQGEIPELNYSKKAFLWGFRNEVFRISENVVTPCRGMTELNQELRPFLNL